MRIASLAHIASLARITPLARVALCADCNFGEDCNFENGRVINGKYFACDRIGSEKRKTYFFKGDNGYFVRAGCFFGTFDEFVDRVHKVHAGTKYETEYIKAVELAKVVLG